MQSYDVIGDIHGHADALIALLAELGYVRSDGLYRHPQGRKALFLGDFIDRCPKQSKVLEIVMPMVEQQTALAVMGNHEFNALAFHTRHPERQDEWLRPRTNKNLKQHIRFLDEYLGDADKLEAALEFFRSLPLWLESDGLRAIHACWADRHIQTLGDNPVLTAERLVEASTKGTATYKALDVLLKGYEYELPKPHTFNDKGGNPRSAARTRWWLNERSTMAKAAMPLGFFEDHDLSDHPIEPDVGYPVDAPPLFIGHYWMEGEPVLMAPNVACLDYSIGEGHKLVAYRWDGEMTLSEQKFVHVEPPFT